VSRPSSALAEPPRARLQWLALGVTALTAVATVAVPLARLREPFVHVVDAAIIELDVRNALDGGQLLGPYSRFGWNHPGPAYFYLLGPAYWLSAPHRGACSWGPPSSTA
jgi:hypothetical protein